MLTVNLNVHRLETLAQNYLNRTWVVDQKTYNLVALGWQFKLNSLKTSLGVCKLKEKIICISQYLYQSNFELQDVWDDTLKHEIAHAIDYEIRHKSDHSYIWKKIANQIGCVPNSCHKDKLKKSNAKYILVCGTCDNKVPKHRYPGTKACKLCCQKYNAGFYSSKYNMNILQNY